MLLLSDVWECECLPTENNHYYKSAHCAIFGQGEGRNMEPVISFNLASQKSESLTRATPCPAH